MFKTEHFSSTLLNWVLTAQQITNVSTGAGITIENKDDSREESHSIYDQKYVAHHSYILLVDS